MAKVEIEIENLTEEQAKSQLSKITKKLDDLDLEDFFGSEGWKHYMGLSD